MSTLQLESLWQFILSMSLSKRNKQWLAERLLENVNDSEKEAELKTKTINAPTVDATMSKNYSPWVQKMAKYRILEPMDDKNALMESLDERYR